MDKTLFFILGSGRMGSTFLFKVLSVHPSIALTNESRVFDALHLAYNAVITPLGEESHLGFTGVVHPDVRDTLVPAFIRNGKKAIEEFFEESFGTSFSHFGDKLPSVAAAFEMSKIWPTTKFVVLLRDPRDVICSYRALQRVPDPTVLGPNWEKFLDQSIEDFALVWQRTYTSVIELLPEFLLVRYESLMAYPLDEVRRVLAFLQLEEAPELEKVIAGNRSPKGHGTSATHKESIERWRRELSPEEIDSIMQCCGPVFDQLKALPGGA